ncbi:MAG: AAA family ATPase [Rhodopila sp.]|nr:AAA family ATPase [Rhodopila sp.]
MACIHCGAEIARGQRFCAGCGSAITFTCHACGADVAPGKRYCGDCGTAVGNHFASSTVKRRSDRGDRRQLTVVFVDLVGSTALSERIDPEDLRDVISSYHACIIDLAKRYGGFVRPYAGDGVLIYFGHPQAHEDDADRAVHLGLDSVMAMRRLDTPAGPPGTLHTRVGIATGLVVVSKIDDGSSIQVCAVGDTPNLAARLQTLAEPDMVVICNDTRQLTGGLFDYADLGFVKLKGLQEAARAWAVLGRSPTENRFEALRHGRRPLVAREEEITIMRRQWRLARLGHGRTILLSGDAGIGKSRLVAAFEASIGHQPHISLHFICSSYHADTPLYPVIRYLERAAGVQRGTSPTAQRAALARLVTGGSNPEQDIALLANLLSIPATADDYARTLLPRQIKEKTFAAILSMIMGHARQAPLVLVVEDLHWADPTTLDLLYLMIDSIDQISAMLVITMRPEAHPHLASRPDVINILLNGLNRRHSQELIANVVMGKILPSAIIDRIISHSDGVPLFIEELTASVLEHDLLLEDTNRLTPIARMSAEVVPKSLQASLLARLDRHVHLKEIAQTASVIGREFSFQTLQIVSDMPPDRLEVALHELEQADLIFVRGQPPDTAYSFKHALLQDAAYGSLLRDRRRAIHRRVAEALAQNEDREVGSDPQIIAWHFAEGGVPDRSIEYYLKAAERATGRSALEEMASHLRQGLRQVSLLPDSPAKSHRELKLQVALGRALIDHHGSGSDHVRSAFERARELCLELQDTQELLRVHDGLMNHHITRAQPEQVLHYADEMLDVGRTTENPQAFLMALRSRGFANLLLGRFAAARDDFRRLLDMYDTRRDGPHTSLTARDPKVSVCTLLGMCLTAMGYPAAGAAMSREALKHADRLGHVVSLVLGLRRACVEAMIQRDAERATALSGRLLAMDAEHEIFLGTREGGIFQSWAQLHTRDDSGCHERLQTCIEQLDAAKHWLMLPFFLASAAERRGHYGDHEGAAALLERAATLVDRTKERWCLAEILRLQACFATHDPDQASKLLEKSLAMAKEQGAKLWELRTATTLATRLRDQGKPQSARDLLSPIQSWFTEGHTTPDLVAAQALLATL